MSYKMILWCERLGRQIGRITYESAAVICIPVSMLLVGCNGLPATSPSPAAGPQTYLSPMVAGTSPIQKTINTQSGSVITYLGATSQLGTYTIDDTADPGTYHLTTTSFNSGEAQGATISNAGTFTVLDRGLRSLAIDYEFPYAGGQQGATYPSPLSGSYAIELPGQAGGLIQLLNEAVTPIVATSSCPSFHTAQNFQFITLPSSGWNPAQHPAFGSVSIITNSDSVSFSNIQQFTLPVNGGSPGTPTTTYATAASGLCSPTPYGNTIAAPTSSTITNPGNVQGVAPSSIFGIGPSGLLIESLFSMVPSNTDLLLGAGTGAIGLPQPSSPVDTGALVGAQYLGFVYGTSWTSTLTSFGFPATLQSNCSSFAAQTGTLVNGIYGGDFPSIDPTGQANGGYGNCDFAIDLGPQSATSNGLYPAATIWTGSSFSANATEKNYSFPAVAIAAQLQGKCVILLIGEDATSHQAWAIYLMQSN
jgi:hypothetical protein